MRPDTERRGLLEVNGETWVMFFTRMMPELKTAARIAEAWKDYKARHGVLVRRGATLSQYLQARSAAGARPVVVLGWESLTVHCAKLKALNPAVLLFDESHNLSSSKRYEFVLLPELPGDPVEAHAMLLQQQNEAKEAGGFIREDDGGRKLFVPYRSAASTAAELARHPSVKRRIALTATPLRNRVRDLYSPLDFIEPNCWGNTTAWMDRYADRKPARYGSGFDTAGASNMEELKTRLAAVAHILTYKETHSQLPPKRRQSFYVAPEDQVKPTGGFSQEHKAALHRGPSAVLEVGLAEAASRKRAAVMGIVEDHLSSGQKVVVFTGRRKDCEILGKSVEALTCVKRDGARVWCTHGEDSSKQRDAFVQEYMAHRGAGCFVSTGHSCGESINLDDTDAALMVQLPWTPDKLRQWEGRFHRASTTRPVLIYYVIAEGTVDEHMAAILIDKLPAVAEVVHDDELASAGSALAGLDTAVSDEEFARSVLADLDWA
jgi:SNF2 family DNA or RNA helicase